MLNKNCQTIRFALLASLLASAQVYATEDLQNQEETSALPHIPRDMIINIFSYLDTKKNLSACGLVCKDWNQAYAGLFSSLIKVNTYDSSSFKHQAELLRLVPDAKIQEVLKEKMAQSSYVFLPQKSPLTAYLPSEFSPLNQDDLLQYLSDVKDHYKALFGLDLPEDHQETALGHLLAALPVSGIYFDKDKKEDGVKKFFASQKEQLHMQLESLRGHQPYLSFFEIPEDLTALKEEAHTIMVMDTQLADDNYKAQLEKLLDTNPNHTVRLSVGKSKFVEGSILKLSAEDLPQKIRHLSLVNPESNFTTIGKDFLIYCPNLNSFDISGFTSLKKIEDFFLVNCNNLNSFDASGLTSVATIGGSFLQGCRNLNSFDTSGLTGVTTIGKKFLFYCRNLTPFNTSGLTSIKTIGKKFLSGCTSLSLEEQDKIRDFLASKGIEWK